MTFFESLIVALIVISIVFAVLIALFFLIKIFSFGIITLEKNTLNRRTQMAAAAGIAIPEHTGREAAADRKASADEEVFSSGHLKLKNVDEPTAAMIMAIVSDESGIPLEELCFKSICRKQN